MDSFSVGEFFSVDADGAQMECIKFIHENQVKGKTREVILIIHGFGGSASQGRALAEAFWKEGYDVYGVSLVGYGHSDDAHKILGNSDIMTTHAHLVRHVVKFIDDERNRCDDIHLVGHSMGAHVLLTSLKERMWDSLPCVATITLLNPAGFTEEKWWWLPVKFAWAGLKTSITYRDELRKSARVSVRSCWAGGRWRLRLQEFKALLKPAASIMKFPRTMDIVVIGSDCDSVYPIKRIVRNFQEVFVGVGLDQSTKGDRCIPHNPTEVSALANCVVKLWESIRKH